MDLAPPPPASAITEPVPRGMLVLLKRAVVEHHMTERRRVFAPVVHVGVPGSAVATLPLGDQRLDHTLRTDAVEAMLRRTRGSGPPPLLWLTRSGTALEAREVDHAWLAASRSASAELALPLPMVVVTRRAWRDPSSGVYRDWARVRPPG